MGGMPLAPINPDDEKLAGPEVPALKAKRTTSRK